MPHKRNPLLSSLILAAVRKVQAGQTVLTASMVQPHERALGAWHAEALALPEMIELTGAALLRVGAIVAGWQVDTAAMRRNLERTGGLVLSERVSLALAPELGGEAKAVVGRIVERVARGDADLATALRDEAALDGRMSQDERAALTDPATYLGAALGFVERVTAGRR